MDIAVVLQDAGAELAGRFEYRTDLYRAATVGRLAELYLALAEAFAGQPDRPVAAVLAEVAM